MTARVDALEPAAPDIVGSWRAFDAGEGFRLRRQLERRAGRETAARIVDELGAAAEALAVVVAGLPGVHDLMHLEQLDRLAHELPTDAPPTDEFLTDAPPTDELPTDELPTDAHAATAQGGV